jgi:hypothetical protein
MATDDVAAGPGGLMLKDSRGHSLAASLPLVSAGNSVRWPSNARPRA